MSRGWTVQLLLLSLVLMNCGTRCVRADIVFYRLPGLPLQIKLQGSIQFNPGGTVTFDHPRFGKLYFATKDVEVHQVPTTEVLSSRQLSKAQRQNDSRSTMRAAQWALHHGLLPQFYEAIDRTLEIDPQHPDALRVKALKRRIDAPLGPTETAERELRKLVPRGDMRIRKSQHFILLHDTPAEPTEFSRLPRAAERLELLEMVYESFLLKFYSQGVELEIPREYLKVVLFREHADYLDYATDLSSDLSMASGFYSKTLNLSVFYDQGTDETFQAVVRLSNELQKAKERALENVTPLTKDIVRLANTICMLVEISRENADIEVVSHEATHQMAGNTGLMPRHVITPTWVAEGIATYFESPNDAAWSGIGAVNKDRLKWYRALSDHREISNVDFIVGDQVFTYAASHGAILHGYGQAWALTHFLLARHFDETMTFYRRLGEMPPDVVLSPEMLTEIFNEVFGDNRRALDQEWRSYMRSLKTDIDVILEQS